MGKKVTRGAMAFASGGLSEVARAGQMAAQGNYAGAIGNSVLPIGPGASANQLIEPTATKVAGNFVKGVDDSPLSMLPAAAKLPDLPMPDQAAVAAKQDEAERQVRLAASTKTNTVATSTRGVLGDAPVNRPSLIGNYATMKNLG